jgi:hypothetical protein
MPKQSPTKRSMVTIYNRAVLRWQQHSETVRLSRTCKNIRRLCNTEIQGLFKHRFMINQAR